MNRYLIAVLFFSISLFPRTAFCENGQSSLLRLPPIVKAPVVDGKIEESEWKDGCIIFGGISSIYNRLSLRDVSFYIAYDKENIYIAQRSEIPPSPMKLVSNNNDMSNDDTFELILRPPDGTGEYSFRMNSIGNGNFPNEVKIANSCNQNFWESEISIPLKLLNIEQLPFGKKWGLQMSRNWQNPQEKSSWHAPTDRNLYGTFIMEENIPSVSFNGLGTRYKRAGYNIQWTTVNSTMNKVKVQCEADILSQGNPEILNDTRIIAPGQRHVFEMRMIGLPMERRLTAKITDIVNNKVLFFRYFDWNCLIGVSWIDPDPPIVLEIGVYPSFKKVKAKINCKKTEKLRTYDLVNFSIRNSDGKIFHTVNAINTFVDFRNEWELPYLPDGKYKLVAELQKNGKQAEILEKDFDIKKFPWNDNQIGMEKIIIPPFKPLKVDIELGKVNALQTGYKLGCPLFDAVYAKNENILSSSMKLIVNGKEFQKIGNKFVTVEPDSVSSVTTAETESLKLEIYNTFDYDGMCLSLLKFKPLSNIRIDSMYLDIPLKAEYARLFHSTNGMIRLNPADFLPTGKGVIWDSRINSPEAELQSNFRPYIWIGEIYKGICWFCESETNYNLDSGKAALEIIRNSNNDVTLRIHIINRPCDRRDPFEITMGFQPTPVKPILENYRKYSKVAETGWPAWTPENSIPIALLWGPPGDCTFWPPNGDYAYIHFLKSKKFKNKQEADVFIKNFTDKNITDEKRKKALIPNLNYGCRLAKNAEYLVPYFNPRGVEMQWDAFATYADEWDCRPYRPATADLYFNDPVKSYQDMALYYNRDAVRNGMDGLYFDNVFEARSMDPTTSPAFEYELGKFRPFFSILNMRRLIKRTATMLYQENKLIGDRPFLILHMTNANIIPLLSFASHTLDWENNYGSREYHQRFSKGYILAESLGTQAGTAPQVLIQASGENISWILHTLLSHMFAYDLIAFAEQGGLVKYPFFVNAINMVYNFGYGNSDVEVFPGWQEDGYPLKTSRKDVGITVLKRKDKTMLLIGDQGNGGSLDIDLSGLNYPVYKTFNAETGTILGTGNQINVKLKNHDYMILLVDAK